MLPKPIVAVGFHVRGQSSDQKDYGNDQSSGENSFHGKPQKGIQPMSAGMMRDDTWNQQSQDKRRKEPVRPEGKLIG